MNDISNKKAEVIPFKFISGILQPTNTQTKTTYTFSTLILLSFDICTIIVLFADTNLR